eukprot:jgi/Picsp_1/6677/NSC_04020-R1_enth vhs family protein
MALNEETFAQRMEKLMNTQESIESTSSWCSLWRSDASSLVLWWELYFSKADTQKRLSMIYLANDVIQTSRKRGPEFVREFLKVLPGAIGDFMRNADEKSKESVERVISVWEKRKVFGRQSEKIKELVQKAAERKPQEPTNTAKAKTKEVAVVPEKVDLPEEVRILLKIVQEADLCSQKRIVAQNAYDKASEDGNVANEILASVLLSYQEALKDEMEHRMKVIEYLNSMIDSQKKVYNVALSAASLFPSAVADQQPIVTETNGPETTIDAVPVDDIVMERYSPEVADEDTAKELIEKNEADELAEKVMNNPQALLELLGAIQGQAGE